MDLDVWFKEKRGFKNILFQPGLIKWVGNEAIVWNRDDQKNRFHRASR